MKTIERIILIDDDEPTNYYNEQVIEMAGCNAEVMVFTNAEEGLSHLRSEAEQSVPETLIFLDLNMPGMNGLEFLDEFETFSSTMKEAIRIVMLTTSLNPEDRYKAEQKGIAGFAHKPLTVERVQQLIKQ